MPHEVQPAKTAVSDKPQRRWYQFSLLSMLVVTTLLCIGPGGYVAYEQAKARKQKAAVEAIKKLGGRVEYEKSLPGRSATMRAILGDDSSGRTFYVWLARTPATDADLSQLRSLNGVTDVFVSNTQVTDAGLVHLARLRKLEYLNFENTKVTSAGLVHLAGLTKLEYLHFEKTQVTDAGLVHLAGLKSLRVLDLSDTQVTDTGLVHLTGLKSLRHLALFNTQVTDVGIATLQKALPDCRIEPAK